MEGVDVENAIKNGVDHGIRENMARRDQQRGKAFERWVGKALGGRRRWSDAGGGSDCDDVPFAVECKAYDQLQLRTKWVEQARRHEASEELPWLIVQRPKGWHHPVATMDFRTLLWLTDAAGLTNQGGQDGTEDSSG